MDIKEKVSQIVAKLASDAELMAKWKRNPTAVLEEYIGIDLPDEQVNQLVEAIEAKLKLDKLGNALGGLKNLF